METACRHLQQLNEMAKAIADAVGKGEMSKVEGCDHMIRIAGKMTVLMDLFKKELNAKVKFHDRLQDA
jgi:hypothetical protein